MKIAQCADIHMQGGPLHHTVARAWSEFYDICLARDVEQVQVLGDTMEDANLAFGQSHTAGDIMKAILTPIIRTQIQTILIEGNHDELDGHESALACFTGVPEITVVSKSEILKFDDGRVHVACLPWEWNSIFDAMPEYQNLSSADFAAAAAHYRQTRLDRIKALWKTGPGFRMLVGHAEINGAVNRYRTIPAGSTHTYDMAALEGTMADSIGFGHYHKRQLCYVGSLVQLNFGEEGNDTGFRIIDTQTGEVEWVNLLSPRYYTVKVEEYEERMATYLNREREIQEHGGTIGEACQNELDLPWVFGQDRVKVRGSRPPVTDGLRTAFGHDDPLPPGVQFEAVVAPPPSRVQTTQEIFADTPVETLIKAWMEARSEARPRVPGHEPDCMCGAPDCPMQQPLVSEASVLAVYDKAMLGGLVIPGLVDVNTENISRIVSLRLRNIGPHVDTFVEFPDGLFAITGPTGVGKTFVLEGFLAAVWREFLYYPGALYDVLPEGFIGDALIESVFETTKFGAEPVRYVARHKIRKTAKTRKIESFLYRVDPAILAKVHEAISPGECGGLRCDCNHCPQYHSTEGQTTRCLVGSCPCLVYKPLVPASACTHPQITNTPIAGSGKEGDFMREVVARFGERDKYVAADFQNQDDSGSLIGMEPGERMEFARRWVGANRFDIGYEFMKAATKGGNDVLLSREGRLSALIGAPEAYAKAMEESASISGRLTAAETARTEARDSLERTRAALDGARTHQATIEAKEQAVTSKIREGQALRAEVEAFERHLTSITQQLAREPELRAAGARLQDLRQERDGIMARREQYATAVGQRDSLNAQALAVRDRIRAAVNESRAVTDKAKYALQLSISGWQAKIREYELAMQHEIHGRQAAMRGLHQQLENAKRTVANLDVAGCRPNFLPCVFIDQARGVSVAGLQRAIDESQADLTAQEARFVALDFAQAERIEVERTTQEMNAIRYADPETLEAEDRELMRQIDAKIEALPKFGIAPDVSQIDQAINQLTTADSELGRMDELRKQLEFGNGEMVAKSAALVTLQQEYGVLVAARDEMLAQGRPDLNEFAMAATKARVAEDDATKALLEIQKAMGGIQERLTAAKKAMEDAQALMREVEAMKVDLVPMQVLQEFFSPRGVPQMLIDTAIPRINDILAGLMDGMIDNPMALWLSTIRETKGGKTTEGLHIQVTDSAGSRDARRTSGGQRNMIKKMLRLGIGMFESQRRGGHHQVYCVDEPTIGLDNDRMVPRMLEVIFKLTETYRQVIVVDHNPALLCGVPQRIELEMVNGKTHIKRSARVVSEEEEE